VRVASAVVLACVGLASCSTNGTANVTLTGPVTLGSEDGFLQKELLTLFGDEQQQAYEDYIEALNLACYYEGQMINESLFPPNYARDYLLDESLLPNTTKHTVVERFVRRNILPTRNTIVMAFATIMAGLFASTLPDPFVTMVMSAFEPPDADDGDGGDGGGGGGNSVLAALLFAKKIFWFVIAVFASITGLIAQLTSSFTTLNRCFQELVTFWSLLFFNDDCNFLLSTRFLSYHEVFSLLVLGCVCLYDLILVISFFGVICAKCCHCVCYVCCCVQNICDCFCCRCWACTNCICYEGCQCFHCLCHCCTGCLCNCCQFCGSCWLALCCPIGLCIAQLVAFLWIALAGFSLVVLTYLVLGVLITAMYVVARATHLVSCGTRGSNDFKVYWAKAYGAARDSFAGMSSPSKSCGSLWAYEFLGRNPENDEREGGCLESPPSFSASNTVFAFQLGTILVIIVAFAEFFNQFLFTAYLSRVDRTNDGLPCWGALLPFFVCDDPAVQDTNGSVVTSLQDTVGSQGLASYGIMPLNPTPINNECPNGYLYTIPGYGEAACLKDNFPARWTATAELFQCGVGILVLGWYRVWFLAPAGLTAVGLAFKATLVGDVPYGTMLAGGPMNYTDFLAIIIALRAYSSFCFSLVLNTNGKVQAARAKMSGRSIPYKNKRSRSWTKNRATIAVA